MQSIKYLFLVPLALFCSGLAAQYTFPTWSSPGQTGDWVSNITIGTWNQTIPETVADNTYNVGVGPGTLLGGTQYTVDLFKTTNWTQSVTLFIDYNGDGDYEDAGEAVGSFFLGGGSNTGGQFNFTVPTTAPSGQTRMRLLVRFGTQTLPLTPTGGFSFGQCDDYDVTISNGSNVTAQRNATSFPTTVANNSVVNVAQGSSVAALDLLFTIQNGNTTVSNTLTASVTPSANITGFVQSEWEATGVAGTTASPVSGTFSTLGTISVTLTCTDGTTTGILNFDLNVVAATLTLSNNNQPAAQIVPGVANFVATSINAAPNTANQTVISATVAKSGTVLDADIAAVKLYVDGNSNGAVDGGDTQIGSNQTFSGGTANFALTVPVPATVDIIIVLDFLASASGSISVDLTAVNVTPGSVVGLPITGVTHATLAAATLPYSTGFESGQPSNLMLITSGTFPTLTSNTATTLAASPTTYTNNSRFQTLQTLSNAYGTINPTGGANYMMLDYPNGISAGAYDFLFDLSAYNPASDAIIFECNWVDSNDDDGALDAVFLSDDGGATWLCPFNLPFSTAVDNQWNFLQLNISTFAQANAMSFTNQFIVRFQASDDFDVYTGIDGFGIDDVAMYRLDDPEIQVVDPSTNNVASGATVNIGNAVIQSSNSFTWTIENLGISNNLDITSISAAPSGTGNCSVTPTPALNPASPIAPQGSATFDTAVTPTTMGPFEFTITVNNNDPDEGTYTIIVQGTGVAPIVNLQRPLGTIIANGNTDTVTQNTSPSGPTNITWTIGNTGAGTLTIASVVTSATSNCSAVAGAPASSTVAPAGTTTVTVAVTPSSAPVTWSFDLTVNSNDPATPAYTITVTGSATLDPPSIQAPATPLSGSPIVITEFTTGTDAFEIQNVTNAAFDATGWVVIVSDDYNNINLANATTQTLGNFAAQQVQHWDDTASSGQYWGSNLFWDSSGSGWIMIVDNTGTVMDFVAFNWNAAAIAGMSVNAGGFTNLNPSAVWNGDGVVDTGGIFARQGTQDNDDATDWINNGTTNSWGTANPGLTLPWSGGAGASIGGAYPAYTGSVFIGDLLDVNFIADDPNPADTLNFTITVTGGTLTAAQAGFNETFPFTPAGGVAPHTASLTGTAAAAGTIELTVSVTDGGLSDSYTYTITIDNPPEMDVFYNTAAVADGGTVNEDILNVGFTQFTFTIENNGGLDVILTGTPLVNVTAGANLFSAAVSANPTTPIPGLGSTTFTVDVTPLAAATGTYDFTVSIDNNDPNENPYDFTVTGNLISNVAPVVTVPTGSNWVNAGGGVFTLTVDPGDTINDSLEVNDATPDNMTIAVTNPATAMLGLTSQPVDITTPTPGPLSLTWTGTADASNPPTDFDWSIAIDDGTTVVTITARIILNDLDPQHAPATGITGTGTVGTPYQTQFVQGDPPTVFVDVAAVTDPNTSQTLTLQNVVRTGGTATGGSGFTYQLAGGVLSVNPTSTLVAADVGTNEYTMDISDGTGSPVTIYVSINVLGSSGGMTFTNTSPLPAATVNQTYTVTLGVSGGTGPYTFSVVNGTSLPVGLTLNTSTGEISGTPTATGVYTFDARAIDSLNDTVTATFQLSVNSSGGSGGGGGGGGGGCAASSTTWSPWLALLALALGATAFRRRRA